MTNNRDLYKQNKRALVRVEAERRVGWTKDVNKSEQAKQFDCPIKIKVKQ